MLLLLDATIAGAGVDGTAAIVATPFASLPLQSAKAHLTGVDPKFPGPLIGPYDQVRQAMRKSVDEIIFNQGDPAKAVNQASTDITKLLQQYQQEG